MERRYRLLLLAYPRDYRDAKGDEIVATLLDAAAPAQTAPTPADFADLLRHAAQRRFCLLVTAELRSALHLCAPWALAIAAGISSFAWWRVEPAVPTTGPLAYAFWLAALAGCVFSRSRALIGVAILATLLTAPLAAFAAMDRPPLWILMALTTLGGIAFAGHGHTPTVHVKPDGPEEPAGRIESGLNVVATAAAVLCGCGLLSPSPDGYYQPIIARVGAVVATGVLATAVFAFARRRQGHSARLPVIAGLLLALPATWLGPIDLIAWNLPVGDLTAARFGRLAHVVLATCAVLCVIAWCLDRGGSGNGRGRRLGSAGVDTTKSPAAALTGMAVGSAAGYGAFAFSNHLGPHAIATVVVLAVLAVLSWARPPVLVVVFSAVAMLTGSWLIGFYSNNWSATAWADPSRTVVLASMLAIVPCSVVAFATFRARMRIAAGVIAAGWICYLSLPALVAWGPLLWVLAALIAITLVRELIQRRRLAVATREINAVLEVTGPDDSAAPATAYGRGRLRVDAGDW